MRDKDKKHKIRAVFAALTAVAALTVALNAAGAGTTDDPIVTLSYINGSYRTQLLKDLIEDMDDSYMSEFKSALRTEIYNEVSAELEKKYPNAAETDSQDTTNPVEYEVVRLTKGQKLRASGACELILRSGSATAFVDSDENRAAGVGLSDCTDGGEILDLNDIPTRHLLVIPRGDGRGITVTSEECYLMVRGEYTIISQ